MQSRSSSPLAVARSSGASTWRSGSGSAWPWSARMARARARCCAASRPASVPTLARCCSTGSRCSAGVPRPWPAAAPCSPSRPRAHSASPCARSCRWAAPPHGPRGQRAAVDRALRATETEGFAERRLSQLSGGERQRVHLARVLAQLDPGEGPPAPSLLLLDEPTNNLDPRHQLRVLNPGQRTRGRAGPRGLCRRAPRPEPRRGLGGPGRAPAPGPRAGGRPARGGPGPRAPSAPPFSSRPTASPTPTRDGPCSSPDKRSFDDPPVSALATASDRVPPHPHPRRRRPSWA